MEVLYKKYRAYIFICCAVLASTFILWLPFILRFSSINAIQTPNLNFETVTKNWDGPLYIIPAKTLYDKTNPLLESAPLGLPTQYFAAHLPLYPLSIRLLASVTTYPKAMLISTVLAVIGLYWMFYYVVKKLKLTTDPLLLTFAFMFITPRFFVARSVGSPEPLFLLLVLSSLFFFAKKNFLAAGLLGGLSLLTKSPGGLLFIAYLLYTIFEYARTKKFNMQWLWILLIPLAFVGLSYFYLAQLGDFWAYFNSGDNLHLLFPPFQVFNHQATWIGTGWLEDILFILFFYGLTLTHLIPSNKLHRSFKFLDFLKNKLDAFGLGEDTQRLKSVFFYFTLVFFLAIISVQHRDISRYSLPLLPIALITFERFFTSRRFILILVLLLPAIYMYSWNFMLTNAAPITEWGPFL